MPRRRERGPSPAEIADLIESEIRAGKLPPKAKLRSRSALAAHYKVGESTVYSMLDKLKDRGMVHGEQGRGVFVNDPSRWRPLPE